MSELSSNLAAVHSEFGATRDRLYEAIARADFKSAAALSSELVGIFARYQSVRADAASAARETHEQSNMRHLRRDRKHLAAVADDPERVEELLTREAIDAIEEGNE